MFSEQVIAGTRTVTNLAAHFVELQQAAREMLESFGGSDRGFFTPSEDDEIRHMLVSYWQSRNAMIELVISFRDDQDSSDESRWAGFLVAYSGALVLVDTARFLREHFHDKPVVREKLNTPEPHFGVPEGTYDRVQKSLTSPVHAWHLYHAATYFDEHKQQLRESAAGTPLAELLEIIEQLQSRIQISSGQYVKARIRVRTRELINTVKRDLLWKALYGLQKAVSRLASNISVDPGHEPALPKDVRNDLRRILEPGDVLVTRKESALTNYFLPGFWPHAAFFLGDSQQLAELGIAGHANIQPRWKRILECDPAEPGRVLEAMKDGVWIRSLANPFACDAILAIRPQVSKTQIAEAITRGIFHDGKAYDFDFDFTRSDRLVCTEVVYRSFEGIGDMSFSLTPRAGRLTLSAEDLIQMALNRNHFEPLAVFSPSHTNQLLTGDEAEVVIRSTLPTSRGA